MRQYNLGIPAKRRGVLRASSTRLALLWIRPGTGGAEQRRGVPESGSVVCATKAEPCCIKGHPYLQAAYLGTNHGTTKTRKPFQVASAGLFEEFPGHLQPSLGRLGASWTHAGDAFLGSLLGQFWSRPGGLLGQLEISWGRFGAGLGASVAVLGPSLGPLGAALGPSWARLGPFGAPPLRGPRGPSSAPLAALLGRLGDLMGRRGPLLGQSGPLFGHSWGHCGPY